MRNFKNSFLSLSQETVRIWIFCCSFHLNFSKENILYRLTARVPYHSSEIARKWDTHARDFIIFTSRKYKQAVVFPTSFGVLNEEMVTEGSESEMRLGGGDGLTTFLLNLRWICDSDWSNTTALIPRRRFHSSIQFSMTFGRFNYPRG